VFFPSQIAVQEWGKIKKKEQAEDYRNSRQQNTDLAIFKTSK